MVKQKYAEKREEKKKTKGTTKGSPNCKVVTCVQKHFRQFFKVGKEKLRLKFLRKKFIMNHNLLIPVSF